jgi:8-oxo-dGTP pyrophosphatase MutT (NUDIX family)
MEVRGEFPVFRRDAECGPGWERRREAVVFDSPYLRVEEVEFVTPSRPGGGVEWLVVRRKNAAIVAPRLSDGRFLLVRQERLPVQRALWEFPAGQIDDLAGSDDPATILRAALAELEEEAGHRLAAGGRMEALGYFFSSQGFTDEHAYLFLADGVEEIPGHDGVLGRGDEAIHEVRAFTVGDLRRMIASNEIADANSLSLWARMSARGLV